MPAPVPVLLAWSGGKDAAWALHALRQRDDVEVVGLLTTLTEGFDRVSMQGIRRDVLHAQARSVGLPVVEGWIPAYCSDADYERTMSAALEDAGDRWPGLRTMAFGDLFLEDIRAYRAQNLARSGWDIVTPLFGSDTVRLSREMVAGGLRAYLCCVDTTQLDGSFSGRAFDDALLDRLPAGIDPCGENGEFHTCVSDGPMFSHPVGIVRGGTLLRDGRFAYTDWLPGPDG